MYIKEWNGKERREDEERKDVGMCSYIMNYIITFVRNYKYNICIMYYYYFDIFMKHTSGGRNAKQLFVNVSLTKEVKEVMRGGRKEIWLYDKFNSFNSVWLNI